MVKFALSRLTSLIRVAQARGGGIYGSHKIQAELRAEGVEVGINRIKRLRKAVGIRCIHKRKFRVTTDSKHKLPIAPNPLNREFNYTTVPNQVWVTDITYIPTDEGWLYLATVKDLHTCEIAGWAMDERMTKQLVCDALRSAYSPTVPPFGLSAGLYSGPDALSPGLIAPTVFWYTIKSAFITSLHVSIKI